MQRFSHGIGTWGVFIITLLESNINNGQSSDHLKTI